MCTIPKMMTVMAILMGLLVMVQAYVLKGMIP